MTKPQKKVSDMTPAEKAQYRAEKKARDEREAQERLEKLQAQQEQKRQLMGERINKLMRDMSNLIRGDLKNNLEFNVGIFESAESWGRGEGFGISWTLSDGLHHRVTEVDEEYVIEEVYLHLSNEVNRIKEQERLRNLAAEVKTRLSPEELEALKKYG